ncbi:hypothetical protein [Aquibium microcysteis]|uniref:hypothetical protein n=1 Tax=Aquibium microcysteis TaxID=675281 RepID=UPI00165CFA79|nr:hypothetical protein [Aquibium microcysteis]
MSIRMRLPGGTLKVKRYPELRGPERRREVPVLAVGGLYLVWWSNAAMKRKAREMEQDLGRVPVHAGDADV